MKSFLSLCPFVSITSEGHPVLSSNSFLLKIRCLFLGLTCSLAAIEKGLCFQVQILFSLIVTARVRSAYS
jgi:hypothetical protein